MFKRLFVLIGVTMITTNVSAQIVKSIELRLISRDLSREKVDPLNIYFEDISTSRILASKTQVFEWRTAYPPVLFLKIENAGLTFSQMDSCIFKAVMKKGREQYKFDCVVKVFIQDRKRPVKKRISDLVFPSTPIPLQSLDSIIRPIVFKTTIADSI